MFHVGEYGERLTIICTEDGDPADISTASTKQFRFELPDKSTLLKTAIFGTDGTDGSLYYIFENGVLKQKGVWKVQAIVTYGSKISKTDIGTFSVGESLKE